MGIGFHLDDVDEALFAERQKMYEKKHLKTARAEAIKEFAERLKAVVAVHNGDMWSKYEYIDNLVKEMVGDDNENL